MFFFILLAFLPTFLLPVDIENSPASASSRLAKGVQFADSLKKAGSFEKAVTSYQEALELAGKAGDRRQEVSCLYELGILSWNLSQFDAASRLIRSAFALADRDHLKDRAVVYHEALEIMDLYNSGRKYREAKELLKSADRFQRALDLARRSGIDEFKLKCLRQLGNYHWETYDLKNFHDVNKEALAIARKLNHRKEEGRCLNNIGLYHWKTNDYSNALKNLEQALLFLEKTDEMETRADSLNNLGLIYKELGDYEKALRYLRECLQYDRERKDVNSIAVDICNIGTIYRRIGVTEKNNDALYTSLENLLNCLQLIQKNAIPKIETELLNNIGLLFCDLKMYDQALSYFSKALENKNIYRSIETLSFIYNNIGIAYSNTQQIDPAIISFKKSVDLAKNKKIDQALWESYLGLGQCYEKKDDFVTALSYYKKAIHVVDRLRESIYLDTFKTGFIRNKLEIYESLIHLLYKINNVAPSKTNSEEIFHYIEKAKARAFLESLGEAKVDIRTKLSPNLRKKEKDLSKEISSLLSKLSHNPASKDNKDDIEQKLSEAEDSYMRLISEMRSDVPEIANLVSPEPCTILDIQGRILDESSALLEYFLGDSHSYMVLITKNEVRFYELPSREQIEASVTPLLKSLTAASKARFAGDLATERIAGEILFPIIEGGFSRFDNLIVVPDGILYYLPFEMLKVRPSRVSRSSSFLIEHTKVSYAPSSSSLLFLAEKGHGPNAGKRVLALGDPVYDKNATNLKNIEKSSADFLRELYLNQGFKFAPLPYSKKEVLDVGKYFPKSMKDIYLREEAKEEVIKKGDLREYQIIHFACHGFMDEKSPLRSSLVLCQDEDIGEDGFLQVREIYNLRINASLVVLSACQTGKGTIEKAEGILGLPRIFFYAGARSVITALWPIGDKSTAFFMKRFYKHLADGDDKSCALQKAKIDMVNSKYSHPFFWAAFIMHGDYSSKISFN